VAEIRRLCAGDIGSNAIKVRVVEVGGASRKTLFEARYPIRLGASAFGSGNLDEEDIALTVSAFEEIAATCRSFGVEHTRVVATSAVREAANRDVLLDAIAARTGFQVEVISGLEEARLLALGLQADLKPGTHHLIIDVGGGSTELIYTRTDLEIDTMHSLRLGAVRLQEMVKPGNPMTKKEFALSELCVRNLLETSHLPVIARTTRAVGVAGTLRAVLDACANRNGRVANSFAHRDVRKLLRTLRGMTIADMETRLGIEPRRGQIIIQGALIVDGIMDLYGLPRIIVSPRGLRDGLIEDMATGHGAAHDLHPADYAVRIGEKYNFDRAHGEHVARLAGQLFDALQPVHQLAAEYRDLLRCAAVLHDIGQFVSYSGHHKHSCYFIQHEEFPGLTRSQQHLVAVIARYHRKALPSEKHPEYQALDPEQRQAAAACAAMLRIADALDREHRQLVDSVTARVENGMVHLEIHARAPVLLELSAAGKKAQMFEKVFGRKIVFRTARTGLERQEATV
jgi:exopolyphosphatase/guanosine-5'-triphosphate,3'-diphosphate pyrophosphatase